MAAMTATMAASSIAPPPGLEAFTPAKIEVESTSFVNCMESTGEWANAVLSISPYLNSEGIHKALAIIDEAIKNAQQAKALDAALAQAPKGSGSKAAFFKTGSPEQLRKQVGERQQELLQELQILPISHGAGQAQAPVPVERPAAPAQGTPKSSPADRKSQPPAKPQQEQQAALKAGRQVQTLSSSLQLLSNVNPDCLFIVRRINKLGFKAARTLKKHFSVYGSVLRVLVAHSTVRQHGDPQCQARRRPSSLGFVQMSSKEAVEAVLALGAEQEVDGSMIRVQKFERQHAMAEIQEGSFGKLAKDDEIIWERQWSGSSSTTAPISDAGQWNQDHESQDSE